MRVLIAGAEGMLGTELVQEFGGANEVLGLGRKELDITNAVQCSDCIARFLPDAIINAAALTDVDGCETSQERAFLVNGQGPANLASAAAQTGCLLVHYSTDYVFDGTNQAPYTEADAANPLSIYGKSKLRGEEMVRRLSPEHLILRTSWAFGRNGRNFIRTVAAAARKQLELRVVHDQRGSPSYVFDLARHTRMMVERRCRGTYHVTNLGVCTWHELAVYVVRCLGLEDVTVMAVSTREFPRPAPRPANSVLENARLKREGLPLMRPWQEAVAEYVKTYLSTGGNDK
jgi:dTDP-4-dehydrorhamnose reductase